MHHLTVFLTCRLGQANDPREQQRNAPIGRLVGPTTGFAPLLLSKYLVDWYLLAHHEVDPRHLQRDEEEEDDRKHHDDGGGRDRGTVCEFCL